MGTSTLDRGLAFGLKLSVYRKEAIFERLKALWGCGWRHARLVSAARLIACGFLGGFAMLSPHRRRPRKRQHHGSE